MNFNTSLLREKFVILDQSKSEDEGQALIALGNRIALPLEDRKGNKEALVIRGQNMHITLRMAARLYHAYQKDGSIVNRAAPYDWDSAWDSILNDFEFAYNRERWIAVYYHGRVIFQSGSRHPFLDMIEKCDTDNKLDYDFAVPMAEDLLRKSGQNIKIKYNGNVAFTIDFKEREGRCGIISRGPEQTTTFSFTVLPKGEDHLNVAQAVSCAAAFLEGIQLAFQIGFDTEKIRLGIIERHTKDEQKVKDARHRLTRLNTEISNMETAFTVRYRPEKPAFDHFLNEAKEVAQKTLRPPEESGEEESEGLEGS